MSAVPGWYSDPEFPAQLRWWNGAEWTQDRQPPPVPASVPPTPTPVTPLPPTQPPPVAVYPPPTPIVDYFPPPERVPPIQRADPVAQPQWHPEPAPVAPANSPRSRGWLWIVGAVAIVALVLGGAFATGHLTLTTASVATPTPTPTATLGTFAKTPQLTEIGAFGNPLPPAGMTALDGGANGTGQYSTAQAELRNSASITKLALSVPACSALSYTSPLTASDQASLNPVHILSSYMGTDGSSKITVLGAVRQYSSASAARASLAAMTAVDKECENGYSNPQGVVQVEGLSSRFPGTTSSSWVQVLPSEGAAALEVKTMNFLSGSLIVRVTCASTGASTLNESQCLSWTTTLQHAVVRAAR